MSDTTRNETFLASLTAKVASMSIDQRVARLQEIADSASPGEQLDEFAKLLLWPETEVTY